MKKKILILNQGNTENYGDVAINDTIVSYFKSKNNDVECFPFWSETLVFGKNYEKYPKIIRYLLWHVQFLLDFCNRKLIKKKIYSAQYDLIIIGGGELLSNHYGFNSSMFIWSEFAKKRNIPLIVLGVSGNIDTPKVKQLRYKMALKRCSKIYVRDNYTKKICEEVYEVKCKCSPDVVFGYGEIMKDYSRLDDNKKNYMLVVPICFLNSIKDNLKLNSEDEYKKYLLKLIKENYKSQEIVITSSEKGDEKFARKFFEFVKKEMKNAKISFEPYTNLSRYLELLKATDLVISGRMHAMILGKVYGCRILPIKFKKKLEVFDKEYTNNFEMQKVEKRVLKTFEEINDYLN